MRLTTNRLFWALLVGILSLMLLTESFDGGVTFAAGGCNQGGGAGMFDDFKKIRDELDRELKREQERQRREMKKLQKEFDRQRREDEKRQRDEQEKRDREERARKKRLRDAANRERQRKDAAKRPKPKKKRFEIRIKRKQVTGNLTVGDIYINGKKVGQTYENTTKRIDSGRYKGRVKYDSKRGHAQGSGGKMSNKGDFLLEVAKARGPGGSRRTAILFHAGEAPKRSTGCIMLGNISENRGGNKKVYRTHTLRKLREHFYGSDTPIACPDVEVQIIIENPPKKDKKPKPKTGGGPGRAETGSKNGE